MINIKLETFVFLITLIIATPLMSYGLKVKKEWDRKKRKCTIESTTIEQYDECMERGK